MFYSCGDIYTRLKILNLIYYYIYNDDMTKNEHIQEKSLKFCPLYEYVNTTFINCFDCTKSDCSHTKK